MWMEIIREYMRERGINVKTDRNMWRGKIGEVDLICIG